MDLKNLNLIYTVLCIWFCVMQHKTQACLYFGQAIASEDFLKVKPTGFQDALTDPASNKWFYLNLVLIVGMLIFYFSISWIFLLIAIINIPLMMVVVKLFLPKVSSQKYLESISKSLNRRIAEYEKKGDFLRSSASQELLVKLELLRTN